MRNRLVMLWKLGFVGGLFLWPVTVNSQTREPTDRIHFARDVRPILANHCWGCHGPDEKTRQGQLRLDSRDAVLARGESGKLAIVSGKPELSEVIKRILATDDKVMPPPEAKRPLSNDQKATLRRWIEQGAEFEPHWAFVPPKAVVPPKIGAAGQNPIDAFVLDRLRREGLSPSPPADRATWLRRVTLDLTGLPPSLDDLEVFLADEAPNAFEKVVDRLLTSPRHAERMAMQWLDAARFADTNGYNNDETRSMWPWRDWVIDAFAQGMPYDQFLIEQLAGDLLPDATIAQKVATGFNRNHVLTTEGGIIEEEYHVEYVADRIHTAATVFMGLSMQCARCHDHKYDPLTQRDYYRFAAYFNNVPDKIVGYSQGRMAEPLLKVPSREQQSELASLSRRKTEIDGLLKRRESECDNDLAAWEKSLTPDAIAKLGPVGLVAQFSLEEPDGEQVRGMHGTQNSEGVIRGKAIREVGKFGKALQFDGNTHVDLGNLGSFESDEKFSLAAWIRPTSNAPSTVLSKMDEAAAHRGYDVILEGAKVASHVVHHWPDKAFKVITKQALSLNEWHHILVTYDGSRKSPGLRIYVDGQPQTLDVTTNNTVDGSLKTDKPFHIGKRHASAPFQGLIDEVQIYSTELNAAAATMLASGQSLGNLKELLAVPAANRSESQKSALRRFFLERIDETSRRLQAERTELPRREADIDKAIPVTMVMSEQTPVRPTFVLRRGQYDQRAEQVAAGVPAVFVVPPLGGQTTNTNSTPTEGESTNSRLDLARWLTSPSHPLTARVAVNRWWEMFFGTGLVETAEDFGLQGSLPSHPELLDWLATELVRSGWNQRAILRLIVLSSTYRQSSGRDEKHARLASHDARLVDPNNRLLWRGPRYRLSAEGLRDNALAVAGLLRERIGGPSVKPYQPDGLWEDVSVERREKYVVDPGDGLYRRSMYTFWKRTCPPPSMTTFDAPDREFCLVRRSRTNTPLQALVMLNDPTYVEAARVLAARVLADTAADDDRLVRAFRLVLSRDPSDSERGVVRDILAEAKRRFTKDPAAAEQLLAVGRSATLNSSPTDLAAWTTILSVLLNLDEAVSKT